MTELAVSLLGPMQVSVHGTPVTLTTGRLRAVLAVLAMSARTTVPVSRLASAVWGTRLPASTRRSVQTYVTRVRRVLGSAVIETRPAGYILQVNPDSVDALRFLNLVRLADRAADTRTEWSRLTAALNLWRGTPFEDVRAAVLNELEAPRLREHYLAALERRTDIDIANGRHRLIAAELSGQAAQHPLRESLWARLLVVLARCGRDAEALAAYETVRKHLAVELGTEPGAELQRMYADLLAGRPPTQMP